MKIQLRDLNLMTSQTVFIGPYLTTKEMRDEFCHNYLLLTEGFLSFPIALPGSGLWKAIQARHKVKERVRLYGGIEILNGIMFIYIYIYIFLSFFLSLFLSCNCLLG